MGVRVRQKCGLRAKADIRVDPGYAAQLTLNRRCQLADRGHEATDIVDVQRRALGRERLDRIRPEFASFVNIKRLQHRFSIEEYSELVGWNCAYCDQCLERRPRT